MAKYLIRTTEVYRCDSEHEAVDLIEASKKDPNYTVTKSSSEIKNSKLKGEIVDEWRRVTITKDFTSEKEPDVSIKITYGEQE